MGIYQWYNQQRLAERYEMSANRHYFWMTICAILIGLCIIWGCLIPTTSVIIATIIIGSFSMFGFIWNWVEGYVDRETAKEIRMRSWRM